MKVRLDGILETRIVDGPIVDDSAFTDGTSRVFPIAAVYRAVQDLVQDGDAGSVQMLQNRMLRASIADSDGSGFSSGGVGSSTILNTDIALEVLSKLYAEDPDAAVAREVTSEEAADSDEGDQTVDVGAHVSDVVKRYHETLTDLQQTYDGTPASDQSAEIDVRRFRQFLVMYSVSVGAGTPGNIKFTVQFAEATSPSNWFTLDTGYFPRWEHEDLEFTAGEKTFAVEGPCLGNFMRVAITTTSTDGSNTFVVDHVELILKN